MGKTWTKAVLCAGILALVVGCACPCARSEYMQPMLSGMLDGKTFVGELGAGEQPMMGETLSFNDGYFHSAICDQFDFGRGAYLAVASGDTVTFEAITRNPLGAVNVWKGTVKGDKLEGTATLYERDKEPVKRWVKATLQ